LIQISAQNHPLGSDWAPIEEVNMRDSPATHRPPLSPEEAICIVDDDEWVAASLVALLETFGFAVRSYASGADFLADARNRTAACLIIDQHMPGMTGLDVVAYLQREGIWQPTILIWARLDAQTTQRAAGLGVTRVVEKPFEADRLVHLIRTAISDAN
jgi:two-component system, LuxR family, response regulator FixJ